MGSILGPYHVITKDIRLIVPTATMSDARNEWW